ncbi:MAG: S-adenosyl-l-methionine hydroxide adenosyltransferase family protein [Candidatus Hodarchaeota archaeon]
MNTVNPSPIVLLTDFGNDPYVGIMKGRILQINPFANVITLTNHIQNHNIRQGAFILLKSYQNFPPNTIFLIVVDPGVGSARRAIAAKCGDYYFVGPDNGILSPILEKKKGVRIIQLTIPEDASDTFHGRDVFAPSAAKLSQNYLLNTLGPPSDLKSSINFFWEPSTNTGEVIFIDHFGNIITNLPYSKELLLNNQYNIITDKVKETVCFKRSYFEGSNIKPFMIVSSFGTLEIALRNRKASKFLDIKPEDRIRILPAEKE